MDETRTCIKCNINLIITEFSIKNKNNKTRRKECKKCFSELTKNHYNKNKDVYKNNLQKRRKTAQTFILEYLEDKSCIDCGISDIRVLEFDHVRGNKITEISVMISKCYSKENILKEIDKCEIRCANCHKIITSIRGNSYKQIYFQERTYSENYGT